MLYSTVKLWSTLACLFAGTLVVLTNLMLHDEISRLQCDSVVQHAHTYRHFAELQGVFTWQSTFGMP